MATNQNPCGGFTKNPYSGNICLHGYINGLLFSEDKQSAITDTNAVLEATWNTLLQQDEPDRVHYLKFDNVEPAESEQVIETFADGTQIILDVTEGVDNGEIVSSDSGLRSIVGELRDGKIVYAWFTTSKGFIKGKEVTEDTIEQVKIRLFANPKKGSPEASEKIVCSYQIIEDNYYTFAKTVDPTDNFDVSALETVRDIEFKSFTISSQTTASVIAKDLDGVGITGLTTGASSYFRLYNLTDDPTRSSAITPSNVTRSGSTYTLTYASQDMGDTMELTYLEPSSSGEVYDLLTDVTDTVTS